MSAIFDAVLGSAYRLIDALGSLTGAAFAIILGGPVPEAGLTPTSPACRGLVHHYG